MIQIISTLRTPISVIVPQHFKIECITRHLLMNSDEFLFRRLRRCFLCLFISENIDNFATDKAGLFGDRIVFKVQ